MRNEENNKAILSTLKKGDKIRFDLKGHIFTISNTNEEDFYYLMNPFGNESKHPINIYVWVVTRILP